MTNRATLTLEGDSGIDFKLLKASKSLGYVDRLNWSARTMRRVAERAERLNNSRKKTTTKSTRGFA